MKNEIAVERNNYVSSFRTEIEGDLTRKINKRTTQYEVKAMFEPTIERIYLCIGMPNNIMNELSSILSKD